MHMCVCEEFLRLDYLGVVSEIVVVIMVSAVVTGYEVDVESKYLFAYFCVEMVADVAVLQHLVIKQIMEQFRMHCFKIAYCIHGFSMHCTCVTFPIVWVVFAFYSMCHVRCEYDAGFL